MSKFRKYLEDKEKYFKTGGGLKYLYPVYEMVATLIYNPKTQTRGSTHLRDGIDLKRIMTTVIVALIPCIFMAFFNTGYQANLAVESSGIAQEGWRAAFMSSTVGYDSSSFLSNFILGSLYFLPLYIWTLIVGGTWELIFAVVRRKEIEEAFLVTSMLYPLILPPNVPIWQAMVALSIGLVLGKEVFGGTGRNLVNPALISRAVLFFAYPAGISGDKVWLAADGISMATPLSQAASDGVSSFSYMQSFLGFIPGSMGETSTIACLIGAAVLIITGIGSWRIMVSCVAGLLAVTSLFYAIGSDTNQMFNLAPHWHLVVGGFAFGTVFMATDPVSAAQTRTGMYYYGFLIGALCALVRVVNPAYPEGMMLAVLFGNVFAPTIDYFVMRKNIKRRMKRIES